MFIHLIMNCYFRLNWNGWFKWAIKLNGDGGIMEQAAEPPCWEAKMFVANCCWIVCQKRTFIWSAIRLPTSGGGGGGTDDDGVAITLFTVLFFFIAMRFTFSSWWLVPCWSLLLFDEEEVAAVSNSECVLMWARKLHARAKHLPHWVHVCGFLPTKQLKSKLLYTIDYVHKRKMINIVNTSVKEKVVAQIGLLAESTFANCAMKWPTRNDYLHYR